LEKLVEEDERRKMKITTRITWDMTTGEVLEHEYFDYEGPLALCDRAAQAAAKTAAYTAGGLGAQTGSEATAAEAALNPFFKQEMGAQHLFTPGQTDELLTAAGAGAGGVAGEEAAALNRNAAVTRNQTALTKSLQDVARDRMKSAAGTSEGIAAQDVMGAKQLQQQGAAGETGLFQTDADRQLKAMGLQTNAINTQIEAGKSGWLQNMNAVITALTNAAKVGKG
jgi:hypothetical protein